MPRVTAMAATRARYRSVVCKPASPWARNGGGVCTCCVQINPVFPASSPYATSVGASIQSPDAPARATNWGVGEAAISLTTGGFYTSGVCFGSRTWPVWYTCAWLT